MKLEAVDPRHPLLIRVATVVAVNNYQLKVRHAFRPSGQFGYLSPAHPTNPLRAVSVYLPAIRSPWRIR